MKVNIAVRSFRGGGEELLETIAGSEFRVVIDKHGAVGVVPIVQGCIGAVVCEIGLSNGELVHFGARRTDLVVSGIARAEFFRPDAAVEIGLLVAEVDVVGEGGRVVAGIAERVVRRIQRHAAIEFEQHIFGGAVDMGIKLDVGGRGDAGDEVGVFEVG